MDRKEKKEYMKYKLEMMKEGARKVSSLADEIALVWAFDNEAGGSAFNSEVEISAHITECRLRMEEEMDKLKLHLNAVEVYGGKSEQITSSYKWLFE